MFVQIGLLMLVGVVWSYPQDLVVRQSTPQFPLLRSDETTQQDDLNSPRLEVADQAALGEVDEAPLGSLVDANLGAIVVEVAKFDESEAGFKDIPRDRSGSNEAGFRLPLPEEPENNSSVPVNTTSVEQSARSGKDFVSVDAAEEDSGRALQDIPRDLSGLKSAGFKLPLPDALLGSEDIAPFSAAKVQSRRQSSPRTQEDAAVLENEPDARNSESDIPRDESGLIKAGFRLPTPDGQTETDDAVIVEKDSASRESKSIADIPRDNSGLNKAGFRLPLPAPAEAAELSAAIVVESDLSADREPKEAAADIQRDESGPHKAGFRLPLPEEKMAETRDALPRDDFVVLDAGEGKEVRTLSDIPRDHSGLQKAGPKLPLPEDQVQHETEADGANRTRAAHTEADFVVVEAGDGGEGRRISDIPRDHSGLKKAGFKLPLPDDEVDHENTETKVHSARLEEHRSAKSGANLTKDKSVCLESIKRSRCREESPFWYFNTASKQCQKYEFGGCGRDTSGNWFATEEECTQFCVHGEV